MVYADDGGWLFIPRYAAPFRFSISTCSRILRVTLSRRAKIIVGSASIPLLTIPIVNSACNFSKLIQWKCHRVTRYTILLHEYSLFSHRALYLVVQGAFGCMVVQL
jgi:hypothetical protein